MAFFRRSAEKTATQKLLRVGTLNPVRSLDPRDAQDTVSVFLLTQVFEPPYAPPPDADTPPRALLFEGPLRQEGNRDGMLFSGRVRGGLKFSDGTPVTAQHVASSLMKAEGFASQAEARAEGERVVFALKRPHPKFAILLSSHVCSVVLEKGGERLGTGAYVVAPGSTPELTRLVRNPHYRTPQAIDEVVFQYYPPGPGDTHDALIRAIEAGEVHYSDALSRDDVGKLQHARKYFQPGVSTCCLFFNTERPHLRDARVRRALATAVDRGEITRLSYENALAFTATSLLPPMMGSFRDGLRFNREQARELLRESGAVLPAKLKLLMPWGPRSYLPHPSQVADTIGEQLGAVGVGVERLPSRDSQDFYRQTCIGDFDLVLIGWIADSADPAEFLDVCLSSRAVPALGKSPAVRGNMARWSDAETDALLERYRQDGREESKQAILKRVADQVPLLPLMYGPSIAVCAWELEGLTPTPIGFPRFGELDLKEKA